MNNKIYDIAIIGGGINGCGIARDASLRGLAVYLCEQGDLGAATSCSSTKLIHGGLRYLEHYEFSLVKKALQERTTLMSLAPHIIWPLTFVLPHMPHLRPKWLIRAGLFLYDNLAKRGSLEKSKALTLRNHSAGIPLKKEITHAFSYSDCWVDDHRLVILNAKQAVQNGATIEPYNKCINARVENGIWHVKTESGVIQAKALVNATGPWADKFIKQAVPHTNSRKLKLVKGSHIVVPKLFEHTQAYIFQQPDGRIVFTIPYEENFTLIGTTDEDYTGNPAKATCTKQAADYLCKAVNAYFKTKVKPSDVVWKFAGVRPLIDDRPESANNSNQKASRDYRISTRHVQNTPIINIWGGKITTYRTLSEDVISALSPWLNISQGKSHNTPLPGGNISSQPEYLKYLQTTYPWLPKNMAKRWVRSYGSLSKEILKNKNELAQLGEKISDDLYTAEIDYLIKNEWLKDAEAFLWRRTKLGLHLTKEQQEAVKEYIKKAICS